MSHLQILPNTNNKGSHNKEFYFLSIRNRYKWLLDMSGEKVLLYKRKYEGTRCPNFDQVRKTNQQHEQDLVCYGTGYVGGYFKPIEIVVSLLTPVTQQVVLEEYGRRRVFKPTSWTLWEPLITTGDILVKRNNQRLWITDVSVTKWKSYILRQNFSTTEIERNNAIYNIPI